MFRDLKAGKIEEANKYVDYKELANIPALGSLEESTEEVKDSENEKILFEELQWNIKKIEKNDEEAKIEVEVTNRDYKTIFENFTKKIVQKVLNNENVTDAETEQYLKDEINNKEISPLTTTQTITVQKQDGKWKVMVDENLRNAIFPGLSEAVNGYAE